MRLSTSGLLMLGLLAGMATRLQAADSADPRAVIRKAIEVMGGEEKLTRLQGSISKGKCKFYTMGQVIDARAEWWNQPPRSLKTVYRMKMGGKSVTRIEVITKDGGWLWVNGKVMPVPADQLAEIYEGLEAEQAVNLLALKDPVYQITSLGESAVANRPAIGLKVAHAGHRDVVLYFDKERGYLVKMQTRAKGTAGEVDDETFYTEYHDYDGILNANKVTTNRDGKPFVEAVTTEFKPVEKIPDRIFAKPTGSAAKQSRGATTVR